MPKFSKLDSSLLFCFRGIMQRHTRTATVATKKKPSDWSHWICFFSTDSLPLTAYLTHTVQPGVEWSVIIMKNDLVWTNPDNLY